MKSATATSHGSVVWDLLPSWMSFPGGATRIPK